MEFSLFIVSLPETFTSSLISSKSEMSTRAKQTFDKSLQNWKTRMRQKRSWNWFAISLEPGFQCQYITQCSQGSSECFMNSRKRAVRGGDHVENLVHGYIFLSMDLIAAAAHDMSMQY